MNRVQCILSEELLLAPVLNSKAADTLNANCSHPRSCRVHRFNVLSLSVSYVSDVLTSWGQNYILEIKEKKG